MCIDEVLGDGVFGLDLLVILFCDFDDVVEFLGGVLIDIGLVGMVMCFFFVCCVGFWVGGV